MIVLELDKVEIDNCLSCGGIWLDAGELELLLDSTEEKDKVLNSFEEDTETKEDKRKCPICLKRMDKVRCGVDKKILIDKCRENHGLWFDEGELCEIIDMGSVDKSNKVLVMLKGMLENDLKKCEEKRRKI